MKTKVDKQQGKKTFEYHEIVEDFTGLIFHCPKCKNEFHLHISEVTVDKTPK